MPDPFTRSQAPSFVAPVTPLAGKPRSPSSRASRRTRRLPRPVLGHGLHSSPTRQIPPSTIRIIPKRPSGATPRCSSLERPPSSPISSILTRNGPTTRKAPGARRWRCGRRKSRSRSRSRQDRLPILPSISKMSPAHSRHQPRSRLSAVTSRRHRVALTWWSALIPNRSTSTVSQAATISISP